MQRGLAWQHRYCVRIVIIMDLKNMNHNALVNQFTILGLKHLDIHETLVFNNFEFMYKWSMNKEKWHVHTKKELSQDRNFMVCWVYLFSCYFTRIYLNPEGIIHVHVALWWNLSVCNEASFMKLNYLTTGLFNGI